MIDMGAQKHTYNTRDRKHASGVSIRPTICFSSFHDQIMLQLQYNVLYAALRRQSTHFAVRTHPSKTTAKHQSALMTFQWLLLRSLYLLPAHTPLPP